jgi:hypothetical protein
VTSLIGIGSRRADAQRTKRLHRIAVSKDFATFEARDGLRAADQRWHDGQ